MDQDFRTLHVMLAIDRVEQFPEVVTFRGITWEEGHHCADCQDYIYSDDTVVKAKPTSGYPGGTSERIYHAECFDAGKCWGDPGYAEVA